MYAAVGQPSGSECYFDTDCVKLLGDAAAVCCERSCHHPSDAACGKTDSDCGPNEIFIREEGCMCGHPDLELVQGGSVTGLPCPPLPVPPNGRPEGVPAPSGERQLPGQPGTEAPSESAVSTGSKAWMLVAVGVALLGVGVLTRGRR